MKLGRTPAEEALVEVLSRLEEIEALLVTAPAPPAYVPLVSDDEMWAAWDSADGCPVAGRRAIEVFVLRRLADWLEENCVAGSAEVVHIRRLACEEEKLCE